MAEPRAILERFFPAMFAEDREVLGGLLDTAHFALQPRAR